ncbi:unnamed protein product [Meloidogyne enterolobii]|uniref:Uncharacterized protein n=1 Tax=Meloidogyne enterolobii TaxID=390850 RepID=A0ACB1BBB3_MELEN
MLGIYLITSAFSLLRAFGPRQLVFPPLGLIFTLRVTSGLRHSSSLRVDSSFHLESLRAFGPRLPSVWTHPST